MRIGALDASGETGVEASDRHDGLRQTGILGIGPPYSGPPDSWPGTHAQECFSFKGVVLSGEAADGAKVGFGKQLKQLKCTKESLPKWIRSHSRYQSP